jgi:ribosome-associated protein
VIRINDELTIDPDELVFRYSTSQGPGGQHVNRSATRVTLGYDVAQSPSLTEDQRERLLRRLASRLDKRGVLQLHSQTSRSQTENRAAVIARLQTLLAGALKEPRRRHKTRPTRAAIEQRLATKRRRSLIKRQRRMGPADET